LPLPVMPCSILGQRGASRIRDPPAAPHRRHIPSLAQQARQRGGEDLADRMVVVLRRPLQQLQVGGREQRRGIEHRLDAAQLLRRHIAV
jgi:hypothetical protein